MKEERRRRPGDAARPARLRGSRGREVRRDAVGRAEGRWFETNPYDLHTPSPSAKPFYSLTRLSFRQPCATHGAGHKQLDAHPAGPLSGGGRAGCPPRPAAVGWGPPCLRCSYATHKTCENDVRLSA